MSRALRLKLAVVIVAVLSLVLLVGSVSVVGASAPQAVSGTWQFVSITPISAQPVDGNCIIELEATLDFQGDLVGTSTNHVRIVRLGPCDQQASEVFQTEGTYQGTVATASGTFDFAGQGNANAQGNLQAQFVIQKGTGGLANLHGIISLTGQLPVGGTYTGEIHFDPA